MRVAIYTLTRERVEYTEHNFALLQEKAGHPFDHFVVDNGSQDETPEFLEAQLAAGKIRDVIWNPENRGISVASNQALDLVGDDYDLIIKMDNDCEVTYDNIIERIVRVYQNMPPLAGVYMLSPRVEGINRQPERIRHTMIDDVEIGITGIVGGLFHVIPGDVYQQFRYDESLPLAQGQDQQICGWIRGNGGTCGYMEPITVAHYETTDGQAARYPEYFERKWKEEL